MPLRRADDDRPRRAGPPTVLVVEDDKSISKLLRIVLDQSGYLVELAEDHGQATEAIQAQDYALFIFDIGLPDGSGLDLIRWVRDDLALTTPIIVLSAYRQDENVDKAFGFGANDFVAKPFRPKELMSRVQLVLGN